MRKNILLTGFSVFAIVGMLFAMFPQNSQAIPPFARKYKTACTTCHWGTFPKLSAFGRAFRANGLRMPGGGDEVFVKDEPVAMGAAAWSRLFPKAVWPGEIPGLPAIGFKMTADFTVTRERPHDPRGGVSGSPERAADSAFQGINDLEVLFGGTFGETLSFFGAGQIAGLERAYVNYAPFIFGEQGLLNVRIGRMEVRATPMSSHRRQLGLSPFIMDIMPSVSNGNFWGFFPGQEGIEFWGSKNGFGGKGGLEWAVGVVNGNTGDGEGRFDGTGDMDAILTNMIDGRNGAPLPDGGSETNNSKDWYATVSYKIGGMGVLGEESVDSSMASKENWQDNSVTIKGYFYKGRTGTYIDNPITGAFGNPVDGGTWDANANRFKRYGVVVDANWWNFNVIGAASFMEDNITGTITYGAGTFGGMLPQESGSNFDTTIYTGEVEYVALPWLIPAFRVENVNPDYDVRDIGSFTKYTFDTTVVTRANYKIVAGGSWSEYQDGKIGTDGSGANRVDLGSIMDTVYRIGVDIAF